jgi:hypothetical protein
VWYKVFRNTYDRFGLRLWDDNLDWHMITRAYLLKRDGEKGEVRYLTRREERGREKREGERGERERQEECHNLYYFVVLLFYY